MSSVKLVVIMYSDFGNARGYHRQLGDLILLTYRRRTANIIHFASNRCKRVTRSVLAAEVHFLIFVFDACYLLYDIIQ